MRLVGVLMLISCLWQSSFANFGSTEIAQFAQQHSESLTERTLPLHYQLALREIHPQLPGPIWKETQQGIYLEAPRNFEIPVKASQVVPFYVESQLQPSNDDKKYLETSKTPKKKKYDNPKASETKKDIKSDDIKFLKDDKVRGKSIKKQKKAHLDATGTELVQQVQTQPEERINKEFQNTDSQLPREYKKEQQYLSQLSESSTTFRTPLDDEYERLSQEGIHFVQSNLFGDRPKTAVPQQQFASEIRDLNSNKDVALKEESNKSQVTQKEKRHKKLSKDNKSEDSGKVEHRSEHDESAQKSYDDKHNIEAKTRKNHLKEKYRGKHKDHGKNKSKQDHEEEHFKKQHETDKGHKHDLFEEKEGHKKGHKTKGYHNKFHKDEVHREHKFYDDDKDQKYHTKKEDTVVNKVVGHDARIIQGPQNRKFIPVHENSGLVQNSPRVVNNNKITRVNNNRRHLGYNKKLLGSSRHGPTPGGARYYTIVNKGKR